MNWIEIIADSIATSSPRWSRTGALTALMPSTDCSGASAEPRTVTLSRSTRSVAMSVRVATVNSASLHLALQRRARIGGLAIRVYGGP